MQVMMWNIQFQTLFQDYIKDVYMLSEGWVLRE